MVAVDDQTTLETLVDPHRQGHRLTMSARRAGLTRVGRVHFHDVPSSFFRFDNEPCEEHRPRDIGDRLRQFGILDHIAHNQRFDRDEAEAGNQLAHFLFDEVLAPIGDPFMRARDDLALLFALVASFGSFGKIALSTSEFRLFLTEKAWIGNCFLRAQIRKGF